MIKGWNYAGRKVPARYKTGTSRRKLWDVRQPIARYLPAYETSRWAAKWRFIHPYLPTCINPTLYHYGHKLNSQIFLTIYFCTRFFVDKKFLHQHFLRHKISHIYFGVCCFFAINNKCRNIFDTNNCNAKIFDAKNDIAKKNTIIFVDLFLQQRFLCQNFCIKNFCVTIFCLFIFATAYFAAYIFVYLIKMTI